MLVTDRHDLKTILAIQKIAFMEESIKYKDELMPPMTETIDQIEAVFDDGTIFFKHNLGNQTIGSVRARLENDICHIGRLIVLPNYQNKGIGKFLMNEVEMFFQPKCLTYKIFTGGESITTIDLYKKIGYHITHYQNNGNYSIVHMEKTNETIK